MTQPSEKMASSTYVNEIPKWGEPYPRILNRQSVLEALTDYISIFLLVLSVKNR